MTMNFETTQNNNSAIVKTLVEKLDATNASELKSELLVLNKNGVNSIVIDMEGTRYCDSSGLSAILAANRLCEDSSGMFILCGMNDNIANLIKIAQLDRVFTLAKNQEEAKSLLK